MSNYKLQITKLQKGMSLLEILVVVAIFSILGVIVTRSVLLTLRGSKKSESQVKVRENVNYALAVIERQLRNADSIVTCPNDPSRIDYIDDRGEPTSFACSNLGGEDSHVASGSGKLTASDIIITSCSFTCSPGASTNPDYVDVAITAAEADAVGIEGANVSAAIKIYLRDY